MQRSQRGRCCRRAAAAAAAGYGEDRAQIEDLQARYLFALDFHDPQLYASTWFFTKRTIFNEGSARWQYKGDRNPAW